MLYIGSAPGHHLDYLAGVLFQDLKFVLYDPAPFNPKLTKIQNVTIKNEFFTMEDAMAFRRNNANLLFVSDIRRLQLVHEEVSCFGGHAPPCCSPWQCTCPCSPFIVTNPRSIHSLPPPPHTPHAGAPRRHGTPVLLAQDNGAQSLFAEISSSKEQRSVIVS